MLLLQGLVQKGQNVICTLHQPSSAIFNTFNQLMLLDAGRVIDGNADRMIDGNADRMIEGNADRVIERNADRVIEGNADRCITHLRIF